MKVRFGEAAAARLHNCATTAADDAIMGHYAAVLRRDGRTEIKLDRFGGYHLFYNLDTGIVSSSFYAICSVLDRLTLSRQSAYEFVFNGVVSGNETLFGEVALAPIGATIHVGARGLKVSRPTLRVTRDLYLGNSRSLARPERGASGSLFFRRRTQLWRSRRLRSFGRL